MISLYENGINGILADEMVKTQLVTETTGIQSNVSSLWVPVLVEMGPLSW